LNALRIKVTQSRCWE